MSTCWSDGMGPKPSNVVNSLPFNKIDSIGSSSFHNGFICCRPCFDRSMVKFAVDLWSNLIMKSYKNCIYLLIVRSSCKYRTDLLISVEDFWRDRFVGKPIECCLHAKRHSAMFFSGVELHAANITKNGGWFELSGFYFKIYLRRLFLQFSR